MLASVEKIIEKMRRQPNNISKEEYEKVLSSLGYKDRGQKGSHRQYRKKGYNSITLVWKTPIKAIYVKQLLKLIDGE